MLSSELMNTLLQTARLHKCREISVERKRNECFAVERSYVLNALVLEMQIYLGRITVNPIRIDQLGVFKARLRLIKFQRVPNFHGTTRTWKRIFLIRTMTDCGSGDYLCSATSTFQMSSVRHVARRDYFNRQRGASG